MENKAYLIFIEIIGYIKVRIHPKIKTFHSIFISMMHLYDNRILSTFSLLLSSLLNLIDENCLFYFRDILSISEFTSYAKIEITKNGYRHLKLNGYTYGETKVTDRNVYWRCTANIRDNMNKSKRCVTHVVTEVRNFFILF